ncbi:histidinol-phosphate transaminase [Sulfitobacter sp. SK012]|uniref:pyridoxal phosphate-dependent aminotransferase n=1 Tax=Sulfitobacter sp. SK012 TaxID=1389005 RepID=UPI000E0AFE83|nr:histidinol-phosphate transaminase [Sulfitobacter sp. SK012]AXI48385.1 histidinol-phosphate transaminase [Sulfitobacter sp. SK012]
MSAPQPYIDALKITETLRVPHPKGLPLIDLSLNESPFAPPQAVLDAICQRAARGNKYGDPFSTDLRTALAHTYNLPIETIICGNGSEELVDLIARAFVRPGDEILMSQNGFYQFQLIAHRLGAKVIRAPESTLTADVDSILSCVTDRTKVIYLALPNNPTGTMPTEEEIHRLIDELPSHVVLVADLAYGEFVGFDFCQRLHDRVADHPNLIVTRTFSKAFSLAAYRLGWCNVPVAIAAVLNTLRAIANVNALAQVAGIAALEHRASIVENIDTLNLERTRVTQGLQSHGYRVEPSQTNFILVTLPASDPRDVDDWGAYLYAQSGIVLRRVREPGLQHYARLCLGTPDQNGLLLEHAGKFITDPSSAN